MEAFHVNHLTLISPHDARGIISFILHKREMRRSERTQLPKWLMQDVTWWQWAEESITLDLSHCFFPTVYPRCVCLGQSKCTTSCKPINNMLYKDDKMQISKGLFLSHLGKNWRTSNRKQTKHFNVYIYTQMRRLCMHSYENFTHFQASTIFIFYLDVGA